MGTINDNRGCSVCEAGKENYTTFSTRLGRKQVKRVQYDYRTPEGDLFACVGQSFLGLRLEKDFSITFA